MKSSLVLTTTTNGYLAAQFDETLTNEY